MHTKEATVGDEAGVGALFLQQATAAVTSCPSS